MAAQSVSAFMSLGATSTELGELSCAYVNDVRASAICAFGNRRELVGVSGGLQPSGAISGMVFAMATRASYPACTTWF